MLWDKPSNVAPAFSRCLEIRKPPAGCRRHENRLFLARRNIEDGWKTSNHRGLVRAMGRWTLTALVINSIIGSGIFGLPSVVAGYLGRLEPSRVSCRRRRMAVVIACFAEVASQFGESGGPYLYAREAFGRFIGSKSAGSFVAWRSRRCAAAAISS